MLAAHRVLHAPHASASYDSVILADSPVGYWPLSEASGTTAFDMSGNGNNGTYTGGYTLGQPGIGDGETAVGFNGSTSTYVTIPDASALDLGAGPFSLECWANLTAVSGDQGFLSKGSGAYYFAASGNQTIASDFGLYTAATSTQTLSANTWMYCVLTVDASSNPLLYIQGVQGTTVSRAMDTSNNTVALQIGSGQSFGPTSGRLAKAAIYNYVLTSTQISNHYAAA